MSFSQPWILLSAPVILVLLLVASARLTARRRRLAEFLGGRRAAVRLGRPGLYRLPVGRTVLLGLAAVFLAAAAAGPAWEDETDEAPTTPMEPPPPSVVLALDISASMQSRDGSPSRLARAAEVARDFRATVEQGRMGLILFSGTPYLLAPPTRDHDVLEYLMDGITPDLVNIYDPGSLPSAALREATRVLTGAPADSSGAAGPGNEDEVVVEEGRSDSAGSAASPDAAPPSPPLGRRTIVLIGDGGAGEPLAAIREAAALAAAEGIRVHTVGVGTPEGGRMLLPAGYTPKGADGTGSPGPMETRLNAANLEALADAGNGLYAHAGNASELDRIRRVLAAPSRETAPELGEPLWARMDPVTALVILALLALLAEGLLDRSPGRARRIRPWTPGPLGDRTDGGTPATGRAS